MSLYYVQKLLYQLNRDPGVRKRFDARREDVLAEYPSRTRSALRCSTATSACFT